MSSASPDAPTHVPSIPNAPKRMTTTRKVFIAVLILSHIAMVIAFSRYRKRAIPVETTSVTIMLPSTSAGMAARIALNPAAVITKEGRSGVYLVVGDTVRFTPVTTGTQTGDLLEVSGLKPGDIVVLSPLEKLKDGRKISFLERK